MPLVSDQLRFLAEDFPDAVGYRVVDGDAMTYSEWDSGASRVGRGLVDADVEPQERVALALEADDALVFLQAYMGVHKAGAINVPVNIRLSAGELRHVLGHSEPHVVIVSAGLADRIAGVLPPSVDTVVQVGGTPDAGDTGVRWVSWEDFLAEDDSDFQVDLDGDAIADILYTSGTTGKPKGVLARHNRATQIDIGRPDDHSGMLYLHGSPFFTFAGVSFINVPPRMGFTGLYMPHFDAGRWLEVCEQEPVGMSFVVPAMVELIVNHDDFGKRDLSSLFMVAVGSAPISPTTLRRFHAALPNATVSNSYSMTEAGAAFCVMPAEEFENRPGSVGQPVPPLEVKIVDDEGEELPPDEIGEIHLKNPGKEREYYKNPEANEETWEEGWLRTGDLGRLDEDGFLYIEGRKKDVIIRGGNNIHAGDVEHVLYDHEDIREAAVVGIPHDVLGEDVAAFIVPVEGADLTEEDVKAWCEDRVADYKRPRHVWIVDELPRNAMGKVLKRDLRDQYTASES